jgi:hypothetical protein
MVQEEVEEGEGEMKKSKKSRKLRFLEWVMRLFLPRYHLTKIYKKRTPKGQPSASE